MFTNLVSFLGKALAPQQVRPVTKKTTQYSNNPFAASPFVTADNYNSSSYGRNQPMRGGYFAGYYNGKANIVGSRLFVEV